MSVSFIGVDGTLDLSNGTASQLLQALGYRVGEGTDGWMLLALAKERIKVAKMNVSVQDEIYGHLLSLEELVLDLERSHRPTLDWV